MWYYKDGALQMESDFVSGNLARQNGSVDGVYKIVYKQRNATLVGEVTLLLSAISCRLPTI